MALDITGKIIQILPETSGVSKAGKEWKKQEFIIETFETYPKKVALSTMGDRLNDLKKFQVGSVITASLNIESREYQGKWYTNVGAWRIAAGEGTPQPGGDPYKQESNSSTQESYSPEPLPTASEAADDLPF